jgi:hypothetical protein
VEDGQFVGRVHAIDDIRLPIKYRIDQDDGLYHLDPETGDLFLGKSFLQRTKGLQSETRNLRVIAEYGQRREVGNH